MRRRERARLRWLGVFACFCATAAAGAPPPFLTFESGPVRPLALSPDGSLLFAANTPDDRLEILRVVDSGLVPFASVEVGLEPVAVAVRSADEVWVVNHLSDSVSIVSLEAGAPRVVRTLLVGDEPRDLVFAGPDRSRAFVTTAHRGQHRSHPSLAGVPGAGDPRLTTPGIGRADVWVFDATAPGDALGGRPLAVVELFGDTPRALAVSPDGGTVYAAVFLSGNRTTTVAEGAVCDGFSPSDLRNACPDELPGVPGGSPGPETNYAGAPAPETGLVVKYDETSGEWRDELGRGWNAAVRFDLPDLDVFAIDATTLAQTAAFAHVGTVLFDMAVNPQSGTLYVSNTEARNEVRFEGPGSFGGSTVQGRLAQARITVIPPDGRVLPRHLNRHLDYRRRPAPAGAKEHSLATPLGMAVSSDGETLYVAAFGSSRIGVFATEELESNGHDPERASAGYLAVSGGGPSGILLDESRQRLYVATRFDDGLSVVDLESGSETVHLTLFDPEPESVVNGRPFLYDATLSSSNGEASCASCHVFGDLDGLVWDLGNPDEDVSHNPIPIVFDLVAELLEPRLNGTGNLRDFHPMKGPMTTQTLRGLKHSGAMHWRGDRATGSNGSDPFASDLSFRNFDVAFEGLLGRESRLGPADMQKFADFALQIVLPPNPIRRLDNRPTPLEQTGHDFFMGPRRADGLPVGPFGNTCNDCHALAPESGHFGTDGEASFEAESQIFKIPHLRNLYQKVGMFGNPPVAGFGAGQNEHQGPQVRGTGFLHDGSIDTLFRFFRASVFDDTGLVGFRDDSERRAMEAFMLAFPSDLAPVVGQQITLAAENRDAVRERLDLLVARAEAPFTSRLLGGTTRECDLVVKGTISGLARGFLYEPERQRFRSDRGAEPRLARAELEALATLPGQELTFTCAPPGSGLRMALDRDSDGFFDRDELDAGTDPADGESVPDGCGESPTRTCLHDGRFSVELEWRDGQDRTGMGSRVTSSQTSALLWFFAPDNWEMLVKVLDGCSNNGHYWVFVAATTNVETTLTVRDTRTNATRLYRNELGVSSPAVTDTAAFPCP